ncbi:MAG TPA: flavin reductase family protein [Mycobacterium sp.]|nr:flavin reductase family protein [Mycobacterium sp.]
MTEHAVQPGRDAFEQVVGLLDYPMFVVTTRAGADRAGCLVGFTSQVSIDPSRFLVGLSKRNHTYRVASDGATHLAVHLLSREHRELARLFGSETGDRVDKFGRCDWWEGPAGLPILADAAALFAGRVTGRFDLGDHVGHLTEPVAGHAPERLGDLVTFADVKDLEPGHEA